MTMHDRVIVAKQSTAATRSLVAEIASLRDDIHQMAVTIAAVELTLLTVFDELRRSNDRCRPPLPDEE